MNKIAIMQPYIFPYIGYYQLINAADIFVILDDVNYITRGWVNRNNILLNGKAHLFSFPVQSASQNKLILQTKLSFHERERLKFLKTFRQAYEKAPYFFDFYPILEEIIFYHDNDLTNFLYNSFIKTLQYIGINKKIMRSSFIVKNNSLKGEERIIELCRKLDADMYINLPGGKELYNHNLFEQNGIDLQFICTLFDHLEYKQFRNDFVSHLSFLDILMFNSKDEIVEMLQKYTLTV